jgi:hypothetical protein
MGKVKMLEAILWEIFWVTVFWLHKSNFNWGVGTQFYWLNWYFLSIDLCFRCFWGFLRTLEIFWRYPDLRRLKFVENLIFGWKPKKNEITTLFMFLYWLDRRKTFRRFWRVGCPQCKTSHNFFQWFMRVDIHSLTKKFNKIFFVHKIFQ